MVLGQLDIPHAKELNVRMKTIKLLEENKDMYLFELGLGSGFLDRTPRV